MVKTRDIDAVFNDVAAKYGSVMRRVCLMYASEAVDYDDLLQEAMVNVWRGLREFRGDATLSTWIYRVTINSCLNWIRTNRRHSGHATLDEAINAVAGDDSERREQLRLMYRMINALPPLDRSLVIMWLDGLSYDEMADVSGLSASNIGVRLHRIKNTLRQRAEKEK